MRRSEQRREAVFALYQHEVTGRPLAELLTEARPFSAELAEGVEANRGELDELISKHARGWSLERIAPLERSIMRVALYEALHRDDVPAEVAIDEAVELDQGVLRGGRARVRERGSRGGAEGAGRGRVTASAPLSGVKALLLDLSGVVYVQDEAVPGAADALARLREAGVPMRLVTNTTMRPRAAILEQLAGLGIEARPGELLTPAVLARRHCERRGYESVSLLVVDELREDLEGLARARRAGRRCRSSATSARAGTTRS